MYYAHITHNAQTSNFRSKDGGIPLPQTEATPTVEGGDWQRWQQVIFCKSKSSHKSFPCKSKSSHKSFPCKSKSSHKSFPCKSKSSHKSFGQTSSQVTSHLVQTQVKSQVSLSKYKSSRTLLIILSSCNTQSGPGIKSIYSELQSKIYEMVNGI